MPTNPFFNFRTRATEQELMQDLIDEAIKIHGLNTYYLKREDVDVDALFGEDELARYEHAYDIEMYLKTTMGFAGASEFISKFGLNIEDQATFSVSRRRFNQLETGLTRPRENDIIWLKLDDTTFYLFDIKFVENKEQLFQLGKLYTYELRCELMTYSHERIQTANTIINSSAQENAYTLEIPVLVGPGAYIPGETVYQGESFVDHNAMATVYDFNDETNILSVQNVSGAFNSSGQIVGVTSNCIRTATDAPSTSPTVADSIADNTRLDTDKDGIIVVRGTHPKRQ